MSAPFIAFCTIEQLSHISEKTIAKQRYLNKKKDCRKKRKIAAIASAPKKAVPALNKDAESSFSESSSDDSDDSDDDEEEESVEEEGEKDVEMHEEKTDEPVIEVSEEASEPSFLTRFPAPSTITQASRRDLAAQGLPEGLARPEVVPVSRNDRLALSCISANTEARLKSLGVTEWFAVQTAIIPKLLEHPSAYDLYPTPPPADVCVSAPTGSGKTLSYVVPIVEVLQRRITRRLRALIILPTRDLVMQVRETLEAVSKGSGLTIASLTGQQSFTHEQSTLPIESKVDIVIATPGRLIDHMDQTPGFTLQHLRFLVIDEADRLLSQSFQEWLPRILNAIDPIQSVQEKNKNDQLNAGFAAPSAMHPAWLQASRLQSERTGMLPGISSILPVRPTNTVQKLLFSATLTRDPAKIVALDLRNASFVSVEDAENDQKDGDAEQPKDWQDSFALPSTLKEHMMVMPTSEKPLHLLHLLYTSEDPLRQVLCFTKSVESAKRLVKLLEFVEEARKKRGKFSLTVREYSGDLRGGQRAKLLEEFKQRSVDVLICSDVISRGIDLPDVRNVISYDVPIDMAKYVHRVGRTARAGRQGDSYTLVEDQEARHFKSMMRRAGRWEKIEKVRMPKTTLPDHLFVQLVQDYQSALQKLEAQYSHKRTEQ
ncbi:DEAD-domain-containing protein [Meira miltonrushii]|uniref:ATP-dependent RNA helicase n=1 Tax=Meira miltonrushii TaxID=1280837 RepID=A0A316VES4_9BASI|nr:DEAD-domain-containing protein [Meira miltonrushii]PWN36030.1 DEAD-domain-containing protein [Meira miltonrushii]